MAIHAPALGQTVVGDSQSGADEGDDGGDAFYFHDMGLPDVSGVYALANGQAGEDGGGLIFVGSDGDDGGDGGSAYVINNGNVVVETISDLPLGGVRATANGGAGGSGGGAVDIAGVISAGGDGAKGGAGGRARLELDGQSSITTDVLGAYGAIVTANGGRGGGGGTAIGGVSSSGGSGGQGGDGGEATGRNNGEIQTSAAASVGFYVSANGGNGGDGGSGVGVVGGDSDGGVGSTGGYASGANSGEITTFGDFSHAMVVQSIGGGGGNAGGGFGGIVRWGGTAQEGSHGGQVFGGSVGDIHTSGANAVGVLMMSIGGAGGDGSSGLNLVSLGGAGAGGGNGGSVTASLGGSIVTTGRSSQAVLIQSIGGGGGNGGDANGIVAIGGQGSGGGDGGEVTVTSVVPLNITTAGRRSGGIVVQSIGGGGGSGGGSVLPSPIQIGGEGSVGGDGGTVSLTAGEGRITTIGARAAGILLQSIGGGGGDGGSTFDIGSPISISVGGKGGAGGVGGTVTGSSGLNIDTVANLSHGLALQSIGGGGGNGGDTLSFGAAIAGITVGGDGGRGGNAGTISFTNRGNISTLGLASRGITAQSIGGGGGDGGIATGGNLGVTISLGGKGAIAGNGGNVGLDTAGNVSTNGFFSTAISAQSIGGGGGNGGAAASISVGLVSVGIGGDSSVGGDGGTVDLTVGEGEVRTEGDFSMGLLAQSIGGGGGDGGNSIGAGAPVSITIGGKGSGGGEGRAVTLVNDSSVETKGHYSAGVVAQSLGGGGGNGGTVANAAFGGVGVNIGGRGAGGGNAATVRLTNRGQMVQTYGDASFGVMAQSIGGGGGNGGKVAAFSAGVDVSIGGSAGRGGNGGEAFLTNESEIRTGGTYAHGLLAQSIGGGGGNGGDVYSLVATVLGGNVTVGGTGGAGGKASAVSVEHDGNITTGGAFARSILAQSIGGGGGNGGAAEATSLNAIIYYPYPSGSFSIGVGGRGGSGGDAGDVEVKAKGTMFGDGWMQSGGIVAQSIGGGGGNGGMGGTYSGGINSVFNIAVSVGGSGDTAGSGGKVRVETGEGLISTVGALSDGILAQSIGGGGGQGAYASAVAQTVPSVNYPSGTLSVAVGGFGGDGNKGGTVEVDNAMDIQTFGVISSAIVAQSIGGGGGHGGLAYSEAEQVIPSSNFSMAISHGLGGFGGEGNAGGTVTVINRGGLYTQREYSNGIVAQSIGGGGGLGGNSLQKASLPFETQQTRIGVAAGAGGLAGGGNHGGFVSVTNLASIWTEGFSSHAILAQSIGGAGGAGGTSASEALGNSEVAVSLSLGGFGGNGGSGGDVEVRNSSSLRTKGDYSLGILAQSIGGGGGSGADSATTAESNYAIGAGMGGLGGKGDSGGKVTIKNGRTGEITTFGTSATAIFAESVGGSGGHGGGSQVKSVGSELSIGVSVGGWGKEGAVGGTVDVENDAVLTTFGAKAHGIVAQSIGGGGGSGGASNALTEGDDDSIQVTLTVGGFGGESSVGGEVIVSNLENATIRTAGYGAYGIWANSIGGGGGEGGAASAVANGGQVGVTVAVGGIAGDGNDGGIVRFNNDGAVYTSGAYSHAAFVQSIGGGGGSSLGATSHSDADIAIGLNWGGFAGSGGMGGQLHIDNSGILRTDGVASYGLFAQSIGGGGGTGGAGRGTSAGTDVSVNVSVGGFGGEGSQGGDINLANSGIIWTKGDLSHAILAQSIGGGGGAGASATAEGADTSADVQVDLSVGGLGGEGGLGGNLRLTNSDEALIRTDGIGAHGIFAQSIGGGGGVGGSANSGNGNASASGDVGIALALGGFAGSGNHGGTIRMENFGRIATLQDSSHAIFAQSIGGGGGSAMGANTSARAEIGIGAGYGGSGGGGGDGGFVEIINAGHMGTSGHGSYGIFAQSIGGGGGAGGASTGKNGGTDVSVTLSVGGFAGSGGDAGRVNVENSGTIATLGDASHAIFVQAVGGGGGVGGATLSGGSNDAAQTNVQLSVGGSGGAGGLGGDITIDNQTDGEIYTQGYGSVGIFAQSIGGGGGFGAAANNVSEAGDTHVSILLGGKGGAGSSGGDIGISNNGLIATDGDLAHGIMAQSIGGGGGAALGIKGQSASATSIGGGYGGSGGAGADGGAVRVSNEGTIRTVGVGALGIFAQSIGGGGGYSAASAIDSASDQDGYMLQLGGTGGAGGNADSVFVSVEGLIYTSGEGAHGVVAQSIGGGGGMGGNAGGENSVGLGIGGFGGAGGDGGNVTVIRTGDIITEGRDAIAIIAQSVGGGGGIGGSGFGRFAADDGSGLPTSISTPGISGDRGNGGIVSIIQDGDIRTFGDRSHGVVVQAVGGGGGLGGGRSLAMGQSGAGSRGGIGDAEDVSAVVRGDIIVQGASSYGLFGQSATGQGAAGAVTLGAQKNVIARGLDSVAAYGESSGNGAVGDIALTLLGDFTVGGGGTGRAIMLVGGDNNQVLNHSLAFALDEAVDLSELSLLGQLNDLFSDLVASGTTGNDQITNAGGRIIGNMDLGTGDNLFLNEEDGSYIGLRFMDLGDAGLFEDHGLTSVRGIGEIGNMAVTGDYQQKAAGRFAVDIDLNQQSHDRMTISGAASFSGTAPLNFLSNDQLIDEYIIASAEDGMVVNGFEPTYRRPTFGLSFRARVENNRDLIVYADKPAFTDLAPQAGAGVGANLDMAQYFDDLEAAASPINPVARVINMMRFLPDAENFGESLTRLTPHYAVHMGEIVNRLTDTGIDAARGCGNSARINSQLGQCVWAQIVPDTVVKTPARQGLPIYRDEMKSFLMGGQAQLGENFAITASLQYSEMNSAANGRDDWLSNQMGDYYAGYLGLKFAKDRFFADALVSYGEATMKGSRNTQLDPMTMILGETLEGEYLPEVEMEGISPMVTTRSKARHIGLSSRVGYRFDSGIFYYEPSVQLDGRWVRMQSSETGSLAAMNLRPHTSFAFSVTPTFELGANIAVGEGMVLRPFAKGRVTFSTADWTMKGGFAAMDGFAGAPDLILRERTAYPLTRLSAGVTVASEAGVELSVAYQGGYAPNSKEHGVMGRLSYRF